MSNVPDCCIVIISSWKFEGEDRMCNLLQDRNLPESLDDLYAGKGREIKAWLASHPASHFVILDDVPDFLSEQMPHYIEINPIAGITQEVVERAVEILNMN